MKDIKDVTPVKVKKKRKTRADKIEFTVEQINQIAGLMSTGTPKGEIAKFMGVSRDTLDRRLNDDPRLSAEINRLFVSIKHKIGQSIINNALRGDLKSAEAYMQRFGGEKWQAPSKKVEVSTESNGPIDLSKVAAQIERMSEEEIKERIARLENVIDITEDSK